MDELQYDSLMRQYNRQMMWEVWQQGKAGLALDGEPARLYEVMEGHMQYARHWDRLHIATDDEIMHNGVNLVLHVTFHTIVENQLAGDDPPAVRQVLRVLLNKGLNQHEAVHAIASALAWEIHRTMRDNSLFDPLRYVRELRKLPLKVDSSRKGRK